MVAAFPQLHHGVEQVGDIAASTSSSSSSAATSSSPCTSFRQEGEVFLQNGSIVFLLDVGELNLQ